jgi:hypothetical protein
MDLTTELSAMSGDFIMSDLTTPALLIYNINLDDIIGFFTDFFDDLTTPHESYELSEMSGTITNLTNLP